MADKQPWAATNAPTYAERMVANHPRLCKAHRVSDGEPCGAFAIRGGNVCSVHGGRAPQVRRKAKQRLDFQKDMMLVRAFRGIPEPEQPPMRRSKPAKAQPAKPPPRRATRPAGPPSAPVERPAPPPVVAAPGREHPPVPAAPEPTPRSATGQLTTEEQAMAAIAPANRRRRVSHIKRRRS